MTKVYLNSGDRKQIHSLGISDTEFFHQLDKFVRGTPYMELVKPAKINDGIKQFNGKEKDKYRQIFLQGLDCRQVVKFVPASGVASRMFNDLLNVYYRFEKTNEPSSEIAESQSDSEREAFSKFIIGLKKRKFAFFDDLKRNLANAGHNIEDLLKAGEYEIILAYLLTARGLNYANLPKALIKFHKYNQYSRTALEEHLVEGTDYTRVRNKEVNIHFTLSPQLTSMVEEHAKRILEVYRRNGIEYCISFSQQKPTTNTVAVDENNQPFRDKDGKIVFRPGGHGALLENLNEIESDIIFIKNIDNIAHYRVMQETISYKMILGGFLLHIQEIIFSYLKVLATEKPDEKMVTEAMRFVEEELLIPGPKYFMEWSLEKRRVYLIALLNRPIRVCGMVNNEGEPGGGPFWVRDSEHGISLQIVEEVQINKKIKQQIAIQKSATHFNPVDIVCGVKDFEDKKFDLLHYTDPRAYFISIKTQDGRVIKALEWPGLWNGGMAQWITLCVEVPIITFNPVKTINDLLRSEHQEK